MAKKRESPSVPVEHKIENPRFSVSFHADGDSMADLHKKMAKAFTGKDHEHPKDDSGDAKKRGGRRGRSGLMKRDNKKRSKRR